jgi:hypothetical protein
MIVYGMLITKTLPGDFHELVFDFVSWDGDRRIAVKKGFVTDFASMRLLPRFMSDDTEEAAAIHDFQYKTGLYSAGGFERVSRWESDMLLYKGLRDNGVAWWRRSLIWTGVRTFGWIPWSRYRRARKSFTKYKRG